MFESKFIEVCNQNECEYTNDSYKIDGEIGSYIHISNHYLKIYHNNILIEISYNLGNSNVAEYKIELSPNYNIPNIQLYTTENIMRLILFKKTPWKIKCADSKLKTLLKEKLRTTGLTQLAEYTAFEPTIIGKYRNSKYNINTKFYIGYENKVESINSIIEFHKEFIDLLLIKYCN